ncbi:MAG: FHA domain-containing serine/threonine-protein kinase [Planctomycetaceae bacterium]
MDVRLSVTAGPDQGRSFVVPTGKRYLIGRGQETDTQFCDPSVSRLHCQIANDTNVMTLSDNRSASGTFVNGQPASEKVLRLGDLIRVGDTEFRIEPLHSADERTIPPRQASVVNVAPKATATSEPRDLNYLLGYTLHRFQLGKAMVKGKTGTIFRAHVDRSSQCVAVKVLWPDLTRNRAEMRRFVRSMKLLKPIQHPNLVRLINAGIREPEGKAKEPLCWYAMEWVDGEDLRSVIRRIGTAGMLDWQTAFRVMLQVAQALEAAFDRGIVHRNISPENILLCKDGVAKLGDLMLAKALEGTAGEQITRPGELLGEIPFMSPERSRGESQDSRSDMYSLGATVYALLTGKPPITATGMAEMLDQIQRLDPVSPKTMQLSVNDQFQAIVMKSLSKRPEERFQTPSELLAELRRVGRYNGLEV